MSYFLPQVNFNCPYLKIGLGELYPVLLECIKFSLDSSLVNSHLSFYYHFSPFAVIF